MDKKNYLITLMEDTEGEGLEATYKGVVIDSLEKAREAQKKVLYDRLNYWMDKWGYTDDYTLEEIFDISEWENEIFVETDNGDMFTCEIEEVEVL
nr:MAG TPA: hypothetical protein [Ackermannviridae sp.]